jgi:hypothetical protein
MKDDGYAKTRPALPPLTEAGAYDPAAIPEYLRAAKRAGMFEAEMARHLNVPLHRLIYWQGRAAKGDGAGIE